MIARLFVLTLAGAFVAAGAAAQAPRSVVPIREVENRQGGAVRYAIVMTVNGVPFEVGLDTGSVGLRLLPRAVQRARVTPGNEAESYAYASGVRLDGHGALARVSLGALQGEVKLQAIERVSCSATKPDCPANQVSPEQYGLMGSGKPGAGFPAIVGIRLAQGSVPNPMAALGVHRWIVHLPQRGRGEGALVLNPDGRDSAGFVPLRAGGDGSRGMVAGCLMALVPEADRVCGPTLFDSGAPGLHIQGAGVPAGWRANVPARLTLTPAAGGPEPAVVFRTGDPAIGSRATFTPDGPADRPLISAGTLPFYALDVLFDGDARTISVRPNPEAGPADHAGIGEPSRPPPPFYPGR